MTELLAVLGWIGLGAVVSPVALLALKRRASGAHEGAGPIPVAGTVRSHFAPTPVSGLTISSREFPHRVRADLQLAVAQVLAEGPTVLHFLGVTQPYSMSGIAMHACLTASPDNPVIVSPPEYEDLDVGESEPLRCLKTGLWLLEQGGARFALLVTPATRHGLPSGFKCEIATQAGPAGFELAQRIFRGVEAAIAAARTYRGRILSLELSDDRYSGAATGIRVHRLKSVRREDLVLPQATLSLLERNVLTFVRLRPALAAAGQPTKKGILFYGPPGTGKTHTIHWLAGALDGQTMLLVTAEQIGLLGEYLALARLLQPSIVVMEDVDLFATDRAASTLCEQSILNRLLNEMDGLRPDAEILFLLTTNRPEALERALASRPGRVDQAIEFPLPDEAGRAKLLDLYACGATLSQGFVPTLARRTHGASAAFVKELMRRAVQFHLERDGSGPVEVRDAEAALDEMLFRGGSLNAALLGGSALQHAERDDSSTTSGSSAS